MQPPRCHLTVQLAKIGWWLADRDIHCLKGALLVPSIFADMYCERWADPGNVAAECLLMSDDLQWGSLFRMLEAACGQ